MRELNNIAESLFDKIRTRFENVNIGDENAKSTTDPTAARFFNFDYVDNNGKNYGNITISIVDEQNLKVYFSKNITDQLGDEDQDTWFSFLRGIRKFAKQNLLNFDVRDINKSNLDLRDIKQQSKSDSTFTNDEVTVTESRMWGTTRSSYQEMGPVRIIVRHNDNVSDDKRGDRSRKIESVFVENEIGERRLLDTKNLHVARAMARHCSEGGQVDDDIGKSIMEMGSEMRAMAHFVREAKRRQFEDVETSQMAQAAIHRYGQLKNKLRHLGGRRGYDSYKMDYKPAESIEEIIDVDALRERFVKKIYDDRFTEALPYVYKAYKEQQDSLNTSMSEEFESWANSIAEDTFETDDQEREALDKLMAKPLKTGQDAIDAQHALEPIFNNDESLNSELTKLASIEGPDADARQTVLNWMKQNGMKIVATEIEQKLQQANSAQTPPAPPTPPTPGPMPTGGTGTDQQVQPPVAESDVAWLRRLAGLTK